MVQLISSFDHCTVMLSVDNKNWGLKPLRMLKCWSFLGYKECVREQCRSFQVEGSGDFVSEEKISIRNSEKLASKSSSEHSG